MDLSNHLNIEQICSRKNKIKKIFFWRICGTGMGAAAILLKQKEYEVQGCDLRFYPPMGPYLKSQGIKTYENHEVSDDLLKEFDLIVIGNVVPGISDEAKRIESLGISFCSFPEALGALVLKDTNVIGVCGTHGKTTTTYYFSQVFKKLGEDPGYFIGGVLGDGPSSYLGNGKYFFIESDEYDSAYFQKESKFLSYAINTMVLTSLEFDHADIFNSIEDIKAEFKKLLPTLTNTSILCSDYPYIRELMHDEKETVFYGEDNIKIENLSDGTSFELLLDKKSYKFKTNLFGRHNIYNLATVIIFALREGFSPEKIQVAISDLKNVKRRQEIRGSFNKAIVIDDFAHHPRAIECTIEAVKDKYNNALLTVVFEPASATARSDFFQLDLVGSFKQADQVILTAPTKPTTAKKLKDIDIEKLKNDIKCKGQDVSIVKNLDELLVLINKNSQHESVLLILSNSTCLGLWESSFVEQLK